MKKLIFGFLLTFASPLLFAQLPAGVTTEPAEYTDPETPLKIIVNLDQLASSDNVIALIAAADAGQDLHFWSWMPFEFPAGSPKYHGTWGASSEATKLTLDAPHIYSFSMESVTSYYEVTSTVAYTNDIMFLVKAKDGSGSGGAEPKTGDLKIPLSPPVTEKLPVYFFPVVPQQSDIITLFYDNDRELKASMQNLGAEECYVYLKATLSDSSASIIPTNFFQVGTNPDLQMKQVAPGRFQKTIIPEVFFNLQPGQQIGYIKAIVMKKNYIAGVDRVDSDLDIDVYCPE
jgi:hypothetical protein